MHLLYERSIIDLLSSGVSSSADSSNLWETESSTSVALPADTNEETEEEESKDETDKLPDVVGKGSNVFM